MKFKYILLASLILAVLTLGVVGASDNFDKLSVSDLENPIEDSIDGDDVISYDDDDDDDDDGPVYMYIEDDDDIKYDTEFCARVSDEGYINGTVSFYVDNTLKHSKSLTDKDKILSLRFYNYLYDYQNYLGNHTVKIVYDKNNIATPFTKNRTVEFEYKSNIDTFDGSTGGSSYIMLDAISGSSGTATLYNYDSDYDIIGRVVKTVSISNGKTTIELNGLSKGYYEYYLNCTINGKNYQFYPDIRVHENTAGYSASVSSQIEVGSNVILSFSGTKKDGWLRIYVDGNEFKKVRYAGGKLSEDISNLSLGQHQIFVEYSKSEDFYCNAFTVNVVPKEIPILALKKVTVKRSAKKLTLSATLKINGKLAGGKTVTFKFNKKTFTAKTDSSGVAKVNIKKSLLKKLKAGKKVSYQASYGSIIKNLSVKVKK